MKRMMTAALALSLLGGTSALAAQPDHDRREARQERRAEKQEKRQERREQKAEKREERRERAVPAAAPRTVREQRQRVQDNRERVQERRQDVRERRDQLQERRQDLRQARQAGADVREQRLRLQQRQDRLQEQREKVRDQRERVQNQRERLQQRAERNNDWYRNYRPGSGYRLRDRDRNRTWWDANHWRRSYQSTHRYRTSRYVYPSGWYVRVWNFGDILPNRSWYSQTYYLDWWRYDLPRPPIGTEWIRMRDDAVLVDIWSGRVLAVYYDLFW